MEARAYARTFGKVKHFFIWPALTRGHGGKKHERGWSPTFSQAFNLLIFLFIFRCEQNLT
jgi:hypothetical protein